MRRPRRAVHTIPGLAEVGWKIREALLQLVCSDVGFLDSISEAIGSAEANAGPTGQQCDRALRAIQGALGMTQGKSPVNPEVPTLVQFQTLRAWAAAAGDPDTAVPTWFEEGAPAGLAEDIPSHGIFPQSDDATADDSGLLHYSEEQASASYDRIDESEAAVQAVHELRDAQPARVKEFNTAQQWKVCAIAPGHHC